MYRRQKNTGESAKGIMHDAPMDHEMPMAKEKSKTSQKLPWLSVAISVSHCGAGCTLGDIIAEFSIFALGLTVAGRALPYEYGGDSLDGWRLCHTCSFLRPIRSILRQRCTGS